MINDKISERREINIKERVTEKRFRNTKTVEYEIIVTAEDWERDKKNKYIKLKFCDENKQVLGKIKDFSTFGTLVNSDTRYVDIT
jgi:hypothetical protein